MTYIMRGNYIFILFSALDDVLDVELAEDAPDDVVVTARLAVADDVGLQCLNYPTPMELSKM